MENQDIYSEESIAKAKNNATEMFYKEGKSLEYVVKQLEIIGYDNTTANQIAYKAMYRQEEDKKWKDKDINNIVVGAFFLIFGISMTVADSGYIFLGAILSGTLLFFKGLFGQIS